MAQVVQDYANAVNTAFSEISTAVDNVVGDINRLNAKIQELENSPDRVTAADQQLITDSLAILGPLVQKAKALDEMTAEPPPPPPPEA